MISKRKMSVLCVVGARPNFMKIAPIMRVFSRDDSCVKATLLHTGQHYDQSMKQSFFDQLSIPEPDIDLGVGGGTHAQQTAEIMLKFEPVVDELSPDAVLVVGDVNSTVACALVASKKGVRIIHVESGLRSYDRLMPEEINRVLTDQLSDLLFTTERAAAENLQREAVDLKNVHFVGNVMIDTLLYNVDRAVPAEQSLIETSSDQDFGVVTFHRPSNVDDPEILSKLISTLIDISRRLPLVFPVHPRTEASLRKCSLWTLLEDSTIELMTPLGYLELLGLMKQAKVVLTDSGGLQEETTALGVPCITIRESTERPITITEGTNVLVGTDSAKILGAFDEIMQNGGKPGRQPEYWDGEAATRILDVLATYQERWGLQ